MSTPNDKAPNDQKPKVVVVENPQADPDVFVLGDVDVIELSSYPASRFCDDAEVLGYGDEHLASLEQARDLFPADSPQWQAIDHMVEQFRARLNEARRNRP